MVSVGSVALARANSAVFKRKLPNLAALQSTITLSKNMILKKSSEHISADYKTKLDKLGSIVLNPS